MNQDSSKLLFFLLLLCKSSIPFGKPFAKAFLFAFDRTGGFIKSKHTKKQECTKRIPAFFVMSVPCR
ncbi:hypothetical protein CLOSTMETH_01579 [[Clostridium] methylpentosum DSM 5476]|uniref:Secreted protein n=1 Tax=[Clostridium] methylpentosum DSM 5476 TaxID=537013 RepID=C0ECK8_9FIRM|nr:hypothetical protein CLOSTMETH_01579 [[Clostridium] methylpentosum DSM 5476]